MSAIIQRHTILLDWHGNARDAAAIQRRANHLCREVLLPALERVLVRLAPDDAHLYMDRLELDLGVWTAESLEKNIAAALVRALEDGLKQKTPTEDSPELPGEVLHSGALRRTTRAASAFEVLLFFLENGRLPWYFRLPEGQNLEKFLEEHVLSVSEGSVKSEVVRPAFLQVLRLPEARQRLVWQFSSGFLRRLTARYFLQAEMAVREIRDKLAAQASEAVPAAERRLWVAAFRALAQQQALSEKVLLAYCTDSLVAEKPERPLTPERRLWKSLWPEVFSGSAPAGTAVPEEQPREAPVRNTAFAEPIYLDHAGMVLLHPFLPQFFAALGVANGAELVEPGRALALLHYLATGEDTAPEYEVSMAKILCGIPLDMPVDTKVTLTREEKDEATALLKALIKHWGALGDSEPDALRGTFLVRPGKLSRKEDDWLLQPEPQTVDILLDQLPWSISAIQTPWMPGMLWVEWGS